MSTRKILYTGDSQAEEACTVLSNGGLVAFPTDTLYALGAQAGIEKSVRKVFEAKLRPTDSSLPVLVAEASDLDRVGVEIPQVAWDFASVFWPGPLTLIVSRSDLIPSLVTGYGDTVAVRMPASSVALSIIGKLGEPVVGTSANITGGPDPVDANEVLRQLSGRIDLIVDGGPCLYMGSSTILDVTVSPPKIIRQGVVRREALEDISPFII
jgi:L-threonylcarbamoyladenylate synthase